MGHERFTPVKVLLGKHPERVIEKAVWGMLPKTTLSRQKVKQMLKVYAGPEHPHAAQQPERSEEHTSELQSQSNIVCRLLLEKKKKNIDPTHYKHINTSISTILT